jgi:hypothetical protein
VYPRASTDIGTVGFLACVQLEQKSGTETPTPQKKKKK